jgi:hypothetical protein
MSTNERVARHAAATVLVALAAVGCGGVVEKGDVSPDTVEKKAHTLAQQTLEAIRPVAGSGPASIGSAEWDQCKTETPGAHRYEYTYVLNVKVPQTQAKAVMDAAKDYFAKKGYELDPPDAEGKRAGAALPKSTWTVRLGVKDSSTIVIQADSDCVFTTHDPPTKRG